MTLQDSIKDTIYQTLTANGYEGISADQVVVQATKPDFEGDFTLVTFGLSKIRKSSPPEVAQEVGELLLDQKSSLFSAFNVIKGFLNLSLNNAVLTDWLHHMRTENLSLPQTNMLRMIEYSSPNTNKPLHFGHMRNIFLGDAMARIFITNGDSIVKANLINDRGIHICKSMLAWKRWGQDASPESTSTKGDHFVGEYYVLFEKELQVQLNEMLPTILEGKYGMTRADEQIKLEKLLTKYREAQTQKEKDEMLKAIKAQVKNDLPYMREAREMLQLWENGDEETYALWERMNNWVYTGFEATYERMGIEFDKMYYESQTYTLGKEMVLEAYKENKLEALEDGSIWVDLESEGLDKKILLRSDGTAVYMTQDIGTARLKFEDYPLDLSIYVIGDEQNYHMKVLKLSLAKMGEPYADKIFHLSYGMVELPDGKMKSREGNVVDADQMLDEMYEMAKSRTEEAGKSLIENDDAASTLYEMIGLGAIKFFLLRVNPKKKMLFDPEESIDLQGFTATAIQYTHARIKSILRKSEEDKNCEASYEGVTINSELERHQILKLSEYLAVIGLAAQEYDPGVLCNYLYDLAKSFNSFYDKCSILKADSPESQALRIDIARWTAETLSHGMKNLGIEVPEKM